MKVEDIMAVEVISVQPGTSLPEVAKLLRKNKIHSLPVIDEKRRLVGIVTEMDFFIKDAASAYLPKWIDLMNQIREENAVSMDEQEKLDYIIDLRAQDIMTEKVVTVRPDTYIKELMEIFKETRFKTFPVVDRRNSLVGIVSLVDVIKSIEM